MLPKDDTNLEGERTREPALPYRPPNWHEPRKRPVHCVIPANTRATVVFVTVCTKDRMRWLASDDVHSLLRSVWLESRAWLVGRYVIMPDHVHLFAGWSGGEVGLETWMRYWKRLFSMKHGDPARRWQSGHWDTTMRDMDHCSEKWEYTINNPVRHALVSDPNLWPYSGVINDFVWP